MSKVQIVWFRDLKLWDLKSNLFTNEMFANTKFPLVELQAMLHKVKIPVLIQDTVDYKRITISGNGMGAKIRDIVKGSTIKIKQQWLVKSGNFLVSKIGARDGAFGIADASLDNAVITSDFWSFDVDNTRIDTYFLFMITTTKSFIEFAKSISSGTALKRINESKFLNAKIPLPPLEIQKEIVAKVESIKAQIKALQEEEKRLKNEIETYIYIALGLQKPKVLARQKVFIVRFKDLTRWDTRHNQSFATNLKNAKSHTDSTTHEADENPAIAESANHSNAFSLDHKALLDSIPTPPSTGWEVKTLGEICEITAGGDKPLKFCNSKTLECQIPIFANGRQNNGLCGYTDEATIFKNALTISARGTIGYAVARFEPFFPIVRLLVCVPKNEINLLYLQHCINSMNVMDSGSNIPQFTIPEAKQIKIPLPPLAVQEQIVMQVEALQSEIKGIDNELNALEQKRLALIQHYLSATNEKERERERERVEQSLSKAEIIRLWTALTQDSAYIHSLDSQTQEFITSFDSLRLALIERKKALQDSITAIFTKLFHQDKPSIQDRIAHALPLGEVSSAESKLDSTPTPPPQGWEIKTLGDICEIVTGCTPQTDKPHFYGQEYPFYKPADLNDGYISESETMLSSLGYRLHRPLPKDSVLVTCIGATIGKTAIIKKSGVCNQQINAILPNEKFLPKYMYFLCSTQHFKNLLLKNCSITTIPIVNKKVFSALQIPLPPLAVQEQIVMQVEQIEEQIATTKQSRLELERELECYLESFL